MSRRLLLSGGALVSLDLQRVPDAGSGAVCRIEMLRPAATAREVTAMPVISVTQLPDLAALRSSRSRVLADGEPGSGRTTALAALAGAEPLVVLHAGDAARDGAAAWLGRLDTMLAGHGGLVAIKEIQLLSPELAFLVTEAVRASTSWVAANSFPRCSAR
jgi:hypothetical protein